MAFNLSLSRSFFVYRVGFGGFGLRSFGEYRVGLRASCSGFRLEGAGSLEAGSPPNAMFPTTLNP